MPKSVREIVEEPIEEPVEDTSEETSEVSSEAAEAEESGASSAKPEPAPPSPKPKGIRVPLAELQAERAKRAVLEAKMQAMESRFESLVSRSEAQQPAAPPIPAYEEDPGGHLRARLEQQERATATWQQQQQQLAQAQQQGRVVQEWAGRFNAEEQAYAAETPDYWEAVQYLKDTRMKEYTTLGWDPMSAQAAIQQEAISIGMDAERRGVSAAERFYELAKLRGFAQAAPSPTPQPVAEQRAKRQQAQSLGPSGKTAKRPTLSELAEMDDEDFDKLTEGNNWRKLWS